MMKYYKCRCGQWSSTLTIALLLLMTSLQGFAQHAASIEKGMLRIKVSEKLASQLETITAGKTSTPMGLTGIQSFDNVAQQFKVNSIQRVFRPAGKFEDKHRRYGLHLWYDIKMDKASSVLDALGAFQKINQIDKIEPVYQKAIIGSEKKEYGPRIVNLSKKYVTLPGAANDPLLPSQWHYNNTGQTGGTVGADIKLFQAWGLETGKPNVIIAITDGGIQVNHPDLINNIWINTNEIPGNGLDDDNNGYVDDINGYGFGDNTGTIAPDPHGTHVGGTIAATTNNGVGVAGIAGGSGVGDGARLMSCAAFGANDSGGFAETYSYGADNGAVISQNSWGYTSPGVFEQAVLDGIDYFIAEAGKDSLGNPVGPLNGGIVIFAAGNDNNNGAHYPGFYPPTLSVSATNHKDVKGWYSNYGSWVDIAAPGGETNTVNQQGVLSTLSNNQYGFFQGTSMATPHVSGVAALIISKYGGPGLTPEMVRGRLVQTTNNIDAVNPSFAGLLGSGRMNAFSALQQNDHLPPDPIHDLAALNPGITTVTLAWTSPLDSGNGSASAYDIRFSTSPITASNIDSASFIVSPPIPKPAGNPESFSVKGLSPGTLYYFAVRARDFFGNVSLISNVAEQATNFPPVIVVSPTSITDTLLTAQTGSQVIAISNVGHGPLTYNVTNFEGSFVSPSQTTDTIPEGATHTLTLTLNATNVLSGVYEHELVILSNDPLHDSTTVPVSLTVINNGAPIASITPDSLNFGGVFVGGSVIKTVSLHNAGSEPLVIWPLAISNPDFTIAITDTLTLNAFRDTFIHVTYTASSLGFSSGTLQFLTNDPVHATLAIQLTGQGLDAPDIVVTPDSLVASLYSGTTATQYLTIQNTGASNLEYNIKIAADTSAQVVASKEIILPVTQITTRKDYQKQTDNKRPPVDKISINAVTKSGAGINVLLLTPDANVTDLSLILNGFGDIHAVTFPVDSLPIITLADLTGYDIVVTTNNGQWLATGGIAPETIGNVLADYIDQGGKVIVNQFAYSYDAWKMAGRFIDEQYGPFIPSTTDANIDTSLGTILAPTHPVMLGVHTLDYSGYVQNVSLAPGATALAQWATGDLFAAVNSNVVALNLLPSLGNGNGLQWSGDLPAFYINAIHWLSGPSFIKVSPLAGVLLPGEQDTLEVRFDASSLSSGTYKASVKITSNVPGKIVTAIPAALTVLGPEFTVLPDSLTEALEQGKTATRTVLLTNNGTESHTFKINIQHKSTARVPSVAAGAENARHSSARIETPKRMEAFHGMLIERQSHESIAVNKAAASTIQRSVNQNSVGSYFTDFENFSAGDINGQQGWTGQYGNWTIESLDAYSGAQHLRGLSDGFGQSLAFSPTVGIGTANKSTTTMKLNLAGSGVTWQIIPQSNTAALVNTRIEFSPAGSAKALVSDGLGGSFYQNITAPVPAGYFDLTIEVDRDSATFIVYFNADKVFTGQGFAGNIEQVVVYSLMEIADPTIDVDDFEIIDGVKSFTPDYLTVSPLFGTISGGESIAFNVDFNASNLAFGFHYEDLIIDISNADALRVPTTLHVIGDPAIEVDPTVIQAVVAYKEDTIKNFEIRNTGGADLQYSLSVIGADTDLQRIKSPVSKFSNITTDKRTAVKLARDKQKSKTYKIIPPVFELYAGSALLNEPFDSGAFPPANWQRVDHTGSGILWNTASAWGEGNYSGTGDAATVSSDAFGPGEFDTELITPTILVGDFQNIRLQYTANYQNYANLDFLDLDIRIDSDSSWTHVLQWNEDHGSFRGTPGEFVSLNLDSYLNNATSFKLRWHYYDPNSGDYDWYAQIDNVVVLGDAKAWLTVSPGTGIVPVGGKEIIEAHFISKDIAPGFYVAGILVNSNAVKTPLVGVVASLQVNNPAEAEVNPIRLSQELFSGETASQTLTISNHGESPLKFSVDGMAIQGATDKPQKRKEAPEKRTTPVTQNLKLNDVAALEQGTLKSAANDLYATGFEEFALGDINGQAGWTGQYGNWTIEENNPSSGARNFSGFSDGFGQSLAFSPKVSIGTDPVSAATMRVDLSNSLGSTWQLIAQSPTAQLVNTRIQISPDGSLQALVKDSLGSAYFQPIPSSIPSGYFELKLEINRSTAWFKIYIDNINVFEGQGFTGNIEQLVVLSLMEVGGPTLDLDNVAILDGTPQSPWLVVNPRSGIVPPGGSLPVTVFFDARTLAGGQYYDTLHINSNDPVKSSMAVPVSLQVDDNLPPVIGELPDTTVVEGQTLSITITATDPDDSLVTVSIINPTAFMTLTRHTNGQATYTVSPSIGQAGDYTLIAYAQDSRGKSDSVVFHLAVLPYGIKNFSLFNISTHDVILNFDDSVTLDIAHPDFANYAIRANTIPAAVGSVIFKVDGTRRNTVNVAPYDLNWSIVTALSIGEHSLYADAYTKAAGKGIHGKGKGAIITVVNKAAVTGFDVVNTTGEVLMALHDGDVINISDNAFRNITIVARTTDRKIGCVVFTLNDFTHVENLAPYALDGDKKGYYTPWAFVAGEYALQGTTYSRSNARGIQGGTSALTFRIIDSDIDSTLLRKAIPDTGLAIHHEEKSFMVYPVPVTDELNIILPSHENIIQLNILSARGETLYQSAIHDTSQSTIVIRTSTLGLSAGLYFVHAIGKNGKREIRKFVIE